MATEWYTGDDGVEYPIEVPDKTLYDGFYYGGNDWDVAPSGIHQNVLCNGKQTGLRITRIDGAYIVSGYEAHYFSMHDALSAIAHNPDYFGLRAI